VKQPLVGLLLAAGAGRRMGDRPKALLRRDGQPLWLALLQALHAHGVRGSVVVTGHHQAAVQADIDAHRARCPHPVHWVHNPTPDLGPNDGLPGSLAVGLRACAPGATVLVLVSDLVALQAADVGELLAAHASRPSQALATLPYVNGTPGHPVVLSPDAVQVLLQEAAKASAFGGFKSWRSQHPQQVHLHTTTNAHFVADADTPQELEALALSEGVRLGW
jgi:molybdenum cofactor cytidylyltransferase